MTREEQVLIRGKVFLYKQKAPFVPSGKSVLGALEYREADDKVRCHECGEWHRSLGHHVAFRHRLATWEYKKRHGLRGDASLSGIRLRAERANAASQRPQLSAFKSAAKQNGLKGSKRRLELIAKTREGGGNTGLAHELRNENGTCQAQILSRIRTMGERLGRTPTARELERDGLSVASAGRALNVSTLSQLVALAGLAPRQVGNLPKYSAELLIEMLRDFYVSNKRIPNEADQKEFKLIPCYSVFKRVFGSMAKAYEAAGLANVARVNGNTMTAPAQRQRAPSEPALNQQVRA